MLAVDRRSTAKGRIFARDRSAIYTSVILIASGRSAIYPYGNVFLLEIDRRSTAKDSSFARGRSPIFLLPFLLTVDRRSTYNEGFLLEIDRRSNVKYSCFTRGRSKSYTVMDSYFISIGRQHYLKFLNLILLACAQLNACRGLH